jgi:RNA polymerase sigma factor (sigma-70 family)
MSLPAWSPGSADEPQPSDEELIRAVRDGRTSAFGELWERHAGAARGYAYHCCSSWTDVDDIVSEAFTRVLRSLRSGGGPESAFRTYVLRSVRNVAIDRGRGNKRLVLTDDLSDEAPDDDPDDPAVAELDKSLAARAFRQLPSSWQTVLWHTAVEQERPAQVAAVTGMTPHNVSALAYRAREGLRQAYLNEYARDAKGGPCAEIAGSLGTYERGSLKKRERALVEQHLSECARCQEVKAEVSNLSATMRAVIGPLLIGGAAAAYLADRGSNSLATEAAGWQSFLRSRTSRAVVSLLTIAAISIALLTTESDSSGSQAQAPRDQPIPLPRGSASVSATPATSSAVPPPSRSTAAAATARSRAPRRSAPGRTRASSRAAAQPVPNAQPSRASRPAARKTSKAAPPPSRATTSAPTPTPAPSVALSIGPQHHAYDATTLQITTKNATARAGDLVITLALPAGIQLADAGSCTNSSRARSPVLHCGSVGNGASSTVTVVLEAIPNPDGTFSSQSGSMWFRSKINGTSATRTAPVEIRCEPPYD